MAHGLKVSALAVKRWSLGLFLLVSSGVVAAAPDVSRFAQLGTDLPTPNVYRTASGAPGHDYWQQRADYQIEATLDETNRRVSARQTITYTCLLYTSPSPRDATLSRMPSSA